MCECLCVCVFHFSLLILCFCADLFVFFVTDVRAAFGAISVLAIIISVLCLCLANKSSLIHDY